MKGERVVGAAVVLRRWSEPPAEGSQQQAEGDKGPEDQGVGARKVAEPGLLELGEVPIAVPDGAGTGVEDRRDLVLEDADGERKEGEVEAGVRDGGG